MRKVEIKDQSIQTREAGAGLTREAGKPLEAGRELASQRQPSEKATAEAGRGATKKVEDSAKTVAVKAAQTAARTAVRAVSKLRAGQKPPPPPPLDVPSVPGLPPPPGTEAVALPAPEGEGLRLWQAPDSPPALSQPRGPQAHSPAAVRPQAHGPQTHNSAAPAKPQAADRLKTQTRQTDARPAGARPSSAKRQPAQAPEITRAKKGLQIKNAQGRKAEKGRAVREELRNTGTAQAGAGRASLFHAPVEVVDSAALPPPKGGQAPARTEITWPGEKKDRPARGFRLRAGRQGHSVSTKNTAVQRGKALAVRQTKQAAARASAKIAATTRRGVAAVVQRVGVVVGAGVKALASTLAPALAAGVAVLLLVMLIGAAASVLGSPFGILYANENDEPGTVPVSTAVGQTNTAFSDYLNSLQSSGNYDSFVIHVQQADWAEVLAVFAVKTALYDGENAADVVTLDEDRVARLAAVFWDMDPVRTRVEEIHHPSETGDDPGWTERILHIYIESRTAEDMKAVYGFTPPQVQALDELLKERTLLAALAADLTISDAAAREVLDQLPEDLSPARRGAVETALSLVGKVSYFWGGCALFLDNLRGNTQ